jgi:AmmeMemoRadiSam system protein A
MAGLVEAAKQELLRIARSAIEEALQGRRPKPQEPENSELSQLAGAFVTLRIGGALRGCIGTLHASEPLYQVVTKMARAAAFEDPRFAPLREEELREVDLEISVLTPLERLADPRKIEVGRHGLYIARGQFGGVLLPQVATEQGWDRVRFLEETCRKAGLPRDAWKSGADVRVFEADVFGED